MIDLKKLPNLVLICDDSEQYKGFIFSSEKEPGSITEDIYKKRKFDLEKCIVLTGAKVNTKASDIFCIVKGYIINENYDAFLEYLETLNKALTLKYGAEYEEYNVYFKSYVLAEVKEK